MRRTKKSGSAAGAPNPRGQRHSAYRSTWLLAAVASLLWWAAFPPLDLSLLAWVAPAVWVHLIRKERLPGRRPYWTIWAISALFWGLLLEGVGRAYWANYLGLIVLGSYLGLYQVLFVWLTRQAIDRWRAPLLLAAPAVWVGLELARAHLVTGFGIAMLGHTQYRTNWVIQIADLGGAYTVSFVMVFVAACFVQSFHGLDDIRRHRVRRWAPILAAIVVLAGAFGYGAIRRTRDSEPLETIQVALIQGTEDTVFDTDIEAATQRSVNAFTQYWRLSLAACQEHPDLALIVWPESVFTGGLPEMLSQGSVLPPPEAEFTPEEFKELLAQRLRAFRDKAHAAAATFNDVGNPNGPRRDTYLLVGTDTIEFTKDQSQTFNSALLVAPSGEVVSRYYKMHRVLLGEYIPLGDTFPALYGLLPIGRGLTPGKSPVSFTVQGVRMSPSICFESTVPHLLRNQFTRLQRQGTAPEVLVNLTNDGWFWGSGILDMQLACAVFRAVELRRPMLVAANTGITAWIDSAGEIRQELPRREEGFVVADVRPEKRTSLYQQLGDLFAWICLGGSMFVLLHAVWERWAQRGINVAPGPETER